MNPIDIRKSLDPDLAGSYAATIICLNYFIGKGPILTELKLLSIYTI